MGKPVGPRKAPEYPEVRNCRVTGCDGKPLPQAELQELKSTLAGIESTMHMWGLACSIGFLVTIAAVCSQ